MANQNLGPVRHEKFPTNIIGLELLDNLVLQAHDDRHIMINLAKDENVTLTESTCQTNLIVC